MAAMLKSLGNGAFFSIARCPPVRLPCLSDQNDAGFVPGRFPAPRVRRCRIPRRTPQPFRPIHASFSATARAYCPLFCLSLPDALRRLNDEGDGTTMPPPVLFRQIVDYFSMVSMVRCVLVNTQMSAAMAMDSFTISEGVMDV